MIFVADRIPRELRRIVEFLNEQMRPAEVLAIEVEQFTNANGLRTLVPRVLGNTERAQSSKSVAPSPDPITEEEWLANLEHEKGPSAKTAADMALSWFREHGFRSAISQSQDSMSLRLTRPDGKFSWPFFVRRSNGKLEASLQYLKEDPAFASDEIRAHLLAAFRSLPGVTISTTKLTGWPAIPLEDLHRPDLWKALQQIALQIKAAAETGQPTYAA